MRYGTGWRASKAHPGLNIEAYSPTWWVGDRVQGFDPPSTTVGFNQINGQSITTRHPPGVGAYINGPIAHIPYTSHARASVDPPGGVSE